MKDYDDPNITPDSVLGDYIHKAGLSKDKIQGWRADFLSVDEEVERSIFSRIIERYAEAAKRGAYKEPADLTDEERIGLAWVSGCQMDFSQRDGKLVIATKNPVGFSKPYPNRPIRVTEQRSKPTPGGTVSLLPPPATQR